MTKPKNKTITTPYPDGIYTLEQLGKDNSLLELYKDGVYQGILCMSDIIKHVGKTCKR